MDQSALIIEVPEAEALVSAWRSVHDPAARRGVPGHVTTLFPFVHPDDLDQAVLDRVRSVVSSTEPFEFRLDRVDQFVGVVWLRPVPDEPFRTLTSLLAGEFPDYPPYGGRHEEPQPHLTLAVVEPGSSQGAIYRDIEAALATHLPVECSATGLSVFVSDQAGLWRRDHIVPLGRDLRHNGLNRADIS